MRRHPGRVMESGKTAIAFVEHRMASKAEGRLRLRAELEKRGAPADAVEEALAAVPDDDLEPTREAAERWQRLHPRGKPTALAQHPEVNALWLGVRIRQFDRVHLGMAVATDDGLIVPVIFDAQAKRMSEISREAK